MIDKPDLVANASSFDGQAKSLRVGSVAVLSFSRIARDRRVLRQCELLTEMGVAPKVLGFASADDNIPFDFYRWPTPRPTISHRIETFLTQVPSHFGGLAARSGFWLQRRNAWALATLKRLKPSLVLANDWPALVVGAECRKVSGCALHYDAHEFATLEFDERLFWRLVYKPMVVQLERAFIMEADTISTVGPRLADAIRECYSLPVTPIVVRNIPGQISLDQTFKTCWPLRILYHGQLLPDRGLEALISSVSFWKEKHHLTLRGDGPPAYVAMLQRMALASDCQGQINFEPSVHPDDVMPLAARSADVGVHFTPLDTDQRHFSLPNKVFEYIGSGLAIAVSPGADLRRIVDQHKVGMVSRDPSAEAIAETVNNLTCEAVADFKKNARIAAETLCWETEKIKMQGPLEELLYKSRE